jgi:hypothetical protein
MAAALTSTAFTGVRLESRVARPSVGGRCRLSVSAAIKGESTGPEFPFTKRNAKKSEVVAAKKLLPYDKKLMDSIPGKAKKMYDARANDGAVYRRAGNPVPSARGSYSFPIEVVGAAGAVGAATAVLIALSYFVSA